MGVRDFFWMVFVLLTIPVVMGYCIHMFVRDGNYDYFEEGKELEKIISGDAVYEY